MPNNIEILTFPAESTAVPKPLIAERIVEEPHVITEPSNIWKLLQELRNRLQQQDNRPRYGAPPGLHLTEMMGHPLHTIENGGKI